MSGTEEPSSLATGTNSVSEMEESRDSTALKWLPTR